VAVMSPELADFYVRLVRACGATTSLEFRTREELRTILGYAESDVSLSQLRRWISTLQGRKEFVRFATSRKRTLAQHDRAFPDLSSTDESNLLPARIALVDLQVAGAVRRFIERGQSVVVYFNGEQSKQFDAQLGTGGQAAVNLLLSYAIVKDDLRPGRTPSHEYSLVA